VSCVKPLAEESIRRLAADVQGVITVEEHSVIGGLGSAVLEALALTPKPTCLIGVQDTFGQSAQSHEELLEHYGLTKEPSVSGPVSLWEGAEVNAQGL